VEIIVKKERIVENPVEVERIVEQEKVVYKVKELSTQLPASEIIDAKPPRGT
jgi:hypothetical protein